MLIMYNESKTNWVKAKITDRLSKYTSSRTLTDGKVKYIDILCSNDFTTATLDGCTSMTTPKVLYDGITNVIFQKKDLKPMIVTANRNDTDILLINIKLDGKIIKNIPNTKAGVLGYLIVKSELFLTVSIRDYGEGCKFEIVLHDPKTVADTTYIFEKADETYKVNIDVKQVEEVISKPKFKINQFRPSRPTNLIFVYEEEVDALKSIINNYDKHTVIVIGPDKNFEELIGFAKKSDYKAVTMFVNDNTVSETYQDVLEMIKKSFRITNVLLNNGKTLHTK